MTGPKICVLGAGIIGLTSAVAIQQNHPSAKITILADTFSPELTSDIAAGLIEPYICGTDVEQIKRWSSITMDYVRRYMKEHPNGGAQEMSGYTYSDTDASTPFWADLMPNFRKLSDDEIKERHPLPQKAGFFFTTLYIEPTKHLAFLQKQFLANGGQIVKRKISNLVEIGSAWDIVVNCTGLGSRTLFGDTLLRPVRGQNVRVRAPAVKHFAMDSDYHVLLNDNCVILGGTKDADEWDTTVVKETAEMILEGCQRLVPALKGAEILSHHVGLRPARTDVRLEVEMVTLNERKVPVVHNYGHGGSGVTLSWGCAQEVSIIIGNLTRIDSKI